jgi:uncharacterized protein YndB with AHSA1/START domain
MANYGGQTLVFELPSPPERVWDALSDPAALNQWFGETNFVARPGLPFSLRPHAGGQLPTVAGEVLVVEPPRRLVTRWRAEGRVLSLTVLVEPGPGGSVLRVAYSDTGGVEEGQLAALNRLYDERLRAFLAGGPLPDAAPAVAAPVPTAPAPPTPAPPAPPAPAGPTRPPVKPAAVAEEPTASKRRRAVVPMAVGAGVVLVLLLVAWTVSGTSLTWGAPGRDDATSAPADPTVPATRAAPASTTASASAPQSTGGTAAATTAAGTGPLIVASQVTNRQPNSLTVAVTITNRSTTGQTWRNVAVGLSSANLTLSNVDSRVNYEWAGTRACFAPGPAVTTIAAGSTITFPFTVTGAVPGDVTTTNLNHTDCL